MGVKSLPRVRNLYVGFRRNPFRRNPTMLSRWSKATRNISKLGLLNNIDQQDHLFHAYRNYSKVLSHSNCVTKTALEIHWTRKDVTSIVAGLSALHQCNNYGGHLMCPQFARSLASSSTSQSSGKTQQEQHRKDMSTVDDPFEAPTYNIPEKPVTFTEGASYGVIIVAGLGVALAAGYAVFKELIFEPKEYKVFGKALERVQNDSQVRVRIGSPITGYGQEVRNRAARQRIPNRTWTDEDGIERVEVNFYIRGPHGAGKVYTEMFKDKVDNEWKYTYLIVEIKSPSPAQLMLESYVPA